MLNFFLKINPHWGENVLKNFQNIGYPIIVIIIIMCSLTCFCKKQIKNGILTLLSGALIVTLLKDPNLLLVWGTKLIKILENIGGDLIV